VTSKSPTPARPASSRPQLSTPGVLRFVREKQLVLPILVVGALVRLLEFGSIPPGLNHDEASLGYDTYALLHHGIDRNGFHNPVLFYSWGSGMAALPGYLDAPFILLFGLSPAPLRAVNLVTGIVSIGVLYALVRRSGDHTLAVIAAFFLAISPWHIMMSRSALDTNLLPALFLGAVYLLWSFREPMADRRCGFLRAHAVGLRHGLRRNPSLPRVGRPVVSLEPP
jgi:predicted membrane-bound mannosyltransferase